MSEAPRAPEPGSPAGPGVPIVPVRPRGAFDEFRAMVVALVPGACVVVLTFVLYQHAVQRQSAAIEAMCASEAGRVREEFGRMLDQRAVALERLAERSSEDPDAWLGDAAALVAGPLRLRAIAEYDTAFVPGRTIPPEARSLSALDPRDDEARRVALELAAGNGGREAVLVSTVPLVAGESEILVCAPVVRASRRTGWIVGVTRLRDVADVGLERSVQDGFASALMEGPTLLHGSRLDEAGPGLGYAGQATIARAPLIWTVMVWPDDEQLKSLESRGPAALFIAGLLLAIFLSTNLYMWRIRKAAPAA